MVSPVLPPAGGEYQTRFTADNSDLERGISRAIQGFRRVDRAAERTNRSLSRTDRIGNNVIRRLRQINTVSFGALSLFGGVQLLQGVRSLGRMDDEVASLQNRLRAIGRESSLGEVVGISISTLSGLDQTARLVSRIGLGNENLNFTLREQFSLVQSINNAFRVGGALTTERRGAALQLSQALSSGRFGGDERRAVLEAAPVIGRIISQSLGVSIGDLYEAPIDARRVAQALLDAAPQLQRQADQLQITWGEAGEVLNTGLDFAVSRSVRLVAVSYTHLTLPTKRIV